MDKELPELVQLCLSGDGKAWVKLVDEYKGLVYGICRLSYIPDQEADDLAQEAFIKIWQNLPNYDPKKGGLKSWVASLTRNLRIDRYRRNRQQRLTDSMDEGWEDTSVSSALQQITDPQQSPYDSAFSNEVAAIIQQAANKISPAMRDVVTLRIVHELDNREISTQLCIPEGTVKSRVNRGCAQLAFLLSPVRAALGVA